mgnify:CR=1 FL=1
MFLNDFLSVERLESGKVKYKFSSFKLSKVVNEVIYNANLMLKIIHPYYEVAIVGEKAHENALLIHQSYCPNKILIGGSKESQLSLLENRFVKDKTMIYVCENKVCQMPTLDINQAYKLLKWKN